MILGDEEEPGEVLPEPAPSTAIASNLSRFPVKVNPPAPVFHPLAYRGVVAEWPIEWRERWGQRANALEDEGLSWRDAEAQAFVEIWTQLRAHQQSANQATASVMTTDVERN